MGIDIPQKNWKAKIVDKKEVASETWEVTIEVIDIGFSFKAGQYIWLVLPKLVYEDSKGDSRAFSICTSAALRGRFSILFRDSSSGFKKTLKQLPLGSEVLIRGPFGYLDFPQDQMTEAVFLAGGVGIAPFMSLIRTTAQNKNTRKITLLYANSDPKKSAYSDELSKISSQNPNIIVKQKIGSIDWDFISQSVTDRNRVIWYVIGREEMVRTVTRLLYDHEIEERNIRFEEFYISRDSFDTSKKMIWNTVEVFKLAAESSFSHIILTDINGKIIFANIGAEQITGFTKSEIIGQTPRLWGGLMDKKSYEKLWQTIKVEKKSFEAEMRNRRKNGQLYQTIARISPILDQTGKLVGFMGTEADISQRLQLEEDLRNKVAELEKINKLMVGRELKMLNLKAIIADLRTKVKLQNKDNMA